MSFNLETLYALLPAVYRLRDADRGEPLRALLSVIADQVGVLEEDLRRLYDDQFIETCSPWAIPYVGDSVGYRALNGSIPEVRSPRSEVADTIALRRHKGTAAMLEVLAREVTGWDARVVEYFELLATTQYLQHLRPGIVLPDLRKHEALSRVGGAFESFVHTADVRRIPTGQGRFNIPNVGIFLWRLQPQPLTASPAFRLDPQRWLFSPLGNSAPLFTRPRRLGAIDEFTQRVDRLNVPDPIGRRIAEDHLDDYYGEEKSFFLTVGGQPLALADVCSCNLGDLLDTNGLPTGNWSHVPPPGGKVAIDPVLGRIAFPDPVQEVEVMFHAGFSDRLGGGEYDREEAVARWYDPRWADPLDTTVGFQFGVTHDAGTLANAPNPSVVGATLAQALAAWDAYTAQHSSGFGIIAVMDSGLYPEALDLDIKIPAEFTLALVAADWPIDQAAHQRIPGRIAASECWPTIARDLKITGTADPASENAGTLILDGLRITGQVSVLPGHLGRLALSHVTVVPWTAVGLDRRPELTDMARITSDDEACRIEADRSILGALRSPATAAVKITGSILDATQATAVAFARPDGMGPGPGASLTIQNSTVVGKVWTSFLELASNSIFVADLPNPDPNAWSSALRSERRQHGCVRFSLLPDLARVPRRFRCQPDLALEARAKELGLASVTDLASDEAERIRKRMVATFHSLSYGDPDYAQLTRRTPEEVRTGAEDGSEMGVFHDLFAPQREENLGIRLDEYLRFGLEAGFFFET